MMEGDVLESKAKHASADAASQGMSNQPASRTSTTASATTHGFSANPNTSPSPAKNTASNQASGAKNSNATGKSNPKKSSYASMLPKMTSSEAEALEDMMGVYTDDTNAFFQEKAREAFAPSSATMQGKSSGSANINTASSPNAQATSSAVRWNAAPSKSLFNEIEQKLTNPVELGMETGKEVIKHFAETTGKMLPEITAKQQFLWNKAVNLQSDLNNRSKYGFFAPDETATYEDLKSTMYGYYNLAAKYGAFEWGIKSLTGLKIALGPIGQSVVGIGEVAFAQPGEHLRTAFEVIGEIGGAGIGGSIGFGVVEGSTFGLGTPAAIAMGVGGAISGSVIGKNVGDDVYDVLIDPTSNSEGFKP